MEPVDCSEAVETHGITGTACYTAFVMYYESGQFGSCCEECRSFRVNSLEGAIRHLWRHFVFAVRRAICHRNTLATATPSRLGKYIVHTVYGIYCSIMYITCILGAQRTRGEDPHGSSPTYSLR
jgi:hypothetical protein